ncbi:MAG: hypothetical protein WCO92_04155, partial [Verrucomicrobiota bacterium]
MFRKDGMSLKKSPLFLLALFIFGTSSLLLGIPMEGDHLLRRQKSNSLTGEQARRDYESSRQDESSEQDERIDDRSGGMESSSFARGASPRIAETPNNRKLGSADGDCAIELSPSLGRLGQHEVTAADSQIVYLNSAGALKISQQFEKEPLLTRNKVNSNGYGSRLDSKIRELTSNETEETEPDCWSGLKDCFASLFGSAAREEVIELTVADRSFLEQNKGVQNDGVDCYLTTALQTLKTVFLQGSATQQANAIGKLTNKPHLVSFLRGILDTRIDGDARALRNDIADLVANDRDLSELDRANINAEGSSRDQADPHDFLRVLLPHLDNSTMRQEIKTRSCIMPGLNKADAEYLARLIQENRSISIPGRPSATRPMVIELQNERQAETATGGTIVDLHLSETLVNKKNLFPTLECDLDNDMPVADMQSLVTKKVVQTQKAFFDDTIEQVCYTERYSQAQRTGLPIPKIEDFYSDILVEEKIGNPPPSSLVITIKRLHANYATEPPTKEKVMMALDHIWEPVVLPGDQEGRGVEYTYVPTFIACHFGSASGGHYVCYRKNGDDWFLFDDSAVEKINLDDQPYKNYSHKDLIMQNACI